MIQDIIGAGVVMIIGGMMIEGDMIGVAAVVVIEKMMCSVLLIGTLRFLLLIKVHGYKW
jgi:hypothetical protein